MPPFVSKLIATNVPQLNAVGNLEHEIINCNFQIRNKMSKENKTSDKQQNGNDFIADVGRSSFTISPKEWNLFQWCYAYVLWALIWCGLINLLVWAFS